MEYLRRFTSGKRIKVPKVNTSQIYWDIASDEDTVPVEAKKRKVDKAVRKKAMTATNSDIIAAHLRAQKQALQVLGDKNKIQKSTDSSDGEIDPEQSDDESINEVSPVKPTQGEIQSENQEESDNVESEDNLSKEALFNKLQEERRISSEWRQKYSDLIASKAYGLTEKTGQEIVDILSRTSNRIIIDDVDDEDTPTQTRAPKEGTVKDGKICIRDNVWITKIAYDDINRETEPSKFITNASYAVWGETVLAARCVRTQSNVAEKELTPSKKGAILKMFTTWMTEKRLMPQHLIGEQLNRTKYNRYFNGAITAAPKKIGYTITKNKNELNKNPSEKGEEIEKLSFPEDDGPPKNDRHRKSAKLESFGKRVKGAKNKPKKS